MQDVFSTSDILGPMSGWSKQDPHMLAVFIYQQSWACAAVTGEPCQHGGESLHYRACDCILKGLTHTHTHVHTQYPCCLTSEKALLTGTLCLTSNRNTQRYVSDLKPDSLPFQPKNKYFPYDVWWTPGGPASKVDTFLGSFYSCQDPKRQGKQRSHACTSTQTLDRT